jgi:NADH-quinone oxidoreductase E subunit
MTETIGASPKPAPFVFSEDNLARARAIIDKYPKGREGSAVLPLLRLAQWQAGWLPQPALDYVADFLRMPPIRVYEVATFYTMFRLKPVGRHHVEVCTNISCWLRGSDDVLAACRERLGIGPGETTEDGMFSVAEAECLGACVNAPMMQIGLDYYEDLTPDSTKAILDELAAGRTPKTGSQIGRTSSEPLGKSGSAGTPPTAAGRKRKPERQQER